MTIDLPLDRMTIEEKLELVDKIWADICKNPDDVPSPDWHKDVLDEIQARIDRGEEKSHPLEEVEVRLRQLEL